jgi:hypothetical protein
MTQASELQQRAIDAIAAIEQRIIETAERSGMHGLRLEWNEDLDFGHLMDPVPVVVISRDGRQAEEKFSLAEMADYRGSAHAQCEQKIEHLVHELAEAQAGGEQADSRGM